jgi:hypothetical protein
MISTGGKDGVALQWIVKKALLAEDQSSSENED